MKPWITVLAVALALGAFGSLGKHVAAASNGAQIYTTNCSSCHGAEGKGLGSAFPPLAGNADVNGPAKGIIHTVKYGLHGSISVNGQSFNGTMPPWSTTLSNADIAAVVTYIRSSWGNKGSAVTTSQVAAVKQ
jgi:mono/diheme cytochrome c family protein